MSAQAGKAVDAALVLVIDGARYLLSRLPASAFLQSAYRLDKQESVQTYECRQTRTRGCFCNCKSWRFGGGKHCKHIRALFLVGLFEP